MSLRTSKKSLSIKETDSDKTSKGPRSSRKRSRSLGSSSSRSSRSRSNPYKPSLEEKAESEKQLKELARLHSEENKLKLEKELSEKSVDDSLQIIATTSSRNERYKAREAFKLRERSQSPVRTVRGKGKVKGKPPKKIPPPSTLPLWPVQNITETNPVTGETQVIGTITSELSKASTLKLEPDNFAESLRNSPLLGKYFKDTSQTGTDSLINPEDKTQQSQESVESLPSGQKSPPVNRARENQERAQSFKEDLDSSTDSALAISESDVLKTSLTETVNISDVLKTSLTENRSSKLLEDYCTELEKDLKHEVSSLRKDHQKNLEQLTKDLANEIEAYKIRLQEQFDREKEKLDLKQSESLNRILDKHSETQALYAADLDLQFKSWKLNQEQNEKAEKEEILKSVTNRLNEYRKDAHRKCKSEIEGLRIKFSKEEQQAEAEIKVIREDLYKRLGEEQKKLLEREKQFNIQAAELIRAESKVQEYWPAPYKTPKGRPVKPTNTEYFQALKEKNTNQDAKRFLRECDFYSKKRTEYNLPPEINPYFDRYKSESESSEETDQQESDSDSKDSSEKPDSSIEILSRVQAITNNENIRRLFVEGLGKDISKIIKQLRELISQFRNQVDEISLQTQPPQSPTTRASVRSLTDDIILSIVRTEFRGSDLDEKGFTNAFKNWIEEFQSSGKIDTSGSLDLLRDLSPITGNEFKNLRDSSFSPEFTGQLNLQLSQPTQSPSQKEIPISSTSSPIANPILPKSILKPTSKSLQDLKAIAERAKELRLLKERKELDPLPRERKSSYPKGRIVPKRADLDSDTESDTEPLQLEIDSQDTEPLFRYSSLPNRQPSITPQSSQVEILEKELRVTTPTEEVKDDSNPVPEIENPRGNTPINNQQYMNVSTEYDQLLTSPNDPETQEELDVLFQKFLDENPNIMSSLVEAIMNKIEANRKADSERDREYLAERDEKSKAEMSELIARALRNQWQSSDQSANIDNLTKLVKEISIGDSKKLDGLMRELKKKTGNKLYGKTGPTLVMFSGAPDEDIEIDDWVEKFRDSSITHDLSLHDTIHYLQDRTISDANRWVKEYLKARNYDKNEPISQEFVDQILAAMNKNFQVNSSAVSKMLFASYKYKQGQKIRVYYNELMKLARRCGAGKEETARVFWGGLPPNLQKHLLYHNAETLQEMLTKAEEFEAADSLEALRISGEYRNTIASVNGTSPLRELSQNTPSPLPGRDMMAREEIEDLAKAIGALSKKIDKTEKEVKDQKRFKANLGQVGTITCQYCGRYGHTIEACIFKSNNDRQQMSGSASAYPPPPYAPSQYQGQYNSFGNQNRGRGGWNNRNQMNSNQTQYSDNRQRQQNFGNFNRGQRPPQRGGWQGNQNRPNSQNVSGNQNNQPSQMSSGNRYRSASMDSRGN